MARIESRAVGRTAGAAGLVYLLLFPIPVVCFLAALVTDAVYASTGFLMWLHFSEWLLAAGLAFGAVTLLILIIQFLVRSTIREAPFGWAHFALFCVALAVELANSFVHTIDGWTAVVPTGLTLSIIGTVLALAAVLTLVRIPVTWVERREVRA